MVLKYPSLWYEISRIEDKPKLEAGLVDLLHGNSAAEILLK